MTKEELHGIVADAVNDSELRSGEIPAIDLYVDQILNLVSSKLEQGSTRFHERQLTKTMINNYSKDGIITPVKGKKYTKEQIIQILTVYTMKSTLSIGEIKRILDGAYSVEGFGGDQLASVYDRYMNIKEENRTYVKQVIDGMIDGNSLDIENDEDFLTALGGIVSMSAFLKNVAQAMIDVKYPAPIEESEEKPSDEDKKREKEKKKQEKVKEKEEKVTEKEEKKKQ